MQRTQRVTMGLVGVLVASPYCLCWWQKHSASQKATSAKRNGFLYCNDLPHSSLEQPV